MNDRYLFKAKDFIGKGNWHKGFLVDISDDKYKCIIYENGSYWSCISKTLCQCTGLKDKAGTLIWENDIVETEKGLYTCIWDNCNLEYSLDRKNESFGLGYTAPYLLKVVGNQFDNPELMEVE